jgi:DtxR family Mn-dependent transcriptional regulator
MAEKKEREEYLEILWYMRENGNSSFDYFQEELGRDFKREIIDELVREDLVIAEEDRISLTEKGHLHTRQLIRSHRLAERLIHDVLGVEYEKGACEFEHILNPDVVDSICTLLGHPRECPHGMPIPEGECCQQKAQTVESSVVPLLHLDVGESAKVAYVHADNDQQLHKLENLCIRPGVRVKVHQRYPTFVLECENSLVALDDEVASNINVWVNSDRLRYVRPHGRRRMRRGIRHGAYRRGPDR